MKSPYICTAANGSRDWMTLSQLSQRQRRRQFEDCFFRVKRGNETDFLLSNDDMTEVAEGV